MYSPRNHRLEQVDREIAAGEDRLREDWLQGHPCVREALTEIVDETPPQPQVVW